MSQVEYTFASMENAMKFLHQGTNQPILRIITNDLYLGKQSDPSLHTSYEAAAGFIVGRELLNSKYEEVKNNTILVEPIIRYNYVGLFDNIVCNESNIHSHFQEVGEFEIINPITVNLYDFATAHQLINSFLTYPEKQDQFHISALTIASHTNIRFAVEALNKRSLENNVKASHIHRLARLALSDVWRS